jgi:hypothetical protein
LFIFVILITTASNQLSGTIPTEIGQLTGLTVLDLRKMTDACVLFMPYSVSINSHILSCFLRRSQFTNNTIVIHHHDIVHCL